MFSYLLRRLLYAPFIIVGVMLITFVLFFVVLLSIVAGLVPALSAARLDPTEALRRSA